MARRTTRALGAAAEELACRYLVDQGLRPIERNFRCRLGEIDLVLLDSRCLVFAEVRYRHSDRFVAAGLTVDYHKQKKLIRTAALYLARRPRFANHTVRFDVVAIEGKNVNWIRDAFRPADASL
ncbi:MAG TPA: YraN family protein [Woeseiaceae bacterium]|nr:YraN family protein [Woeseiaceae bacterium]